MLMKFADVIQKEQADSGYSEITQLTQKTGVKEVEIWQHKT